jgi:hypothetical protein
VSSKKKSRCKGEGKKFETKSERRLDDDVYITDSAFNDYLTNYQIMNKNNCSKIHEFLGEKRDRIAANLERELQQKNSIKFNLTLETVLQAGGDAEVRDWAFNTESEALFRGGDKDALIDELFDKLVDRLENYIIEKSGWKVVLLQNTIL